MGSLPHRLAIGSSATRRTLRLVRAIGLQLVGLVDNDPEKHGTIRGDLIISALSLINDLAPAAVVITTFRHASELLHRIDWISVGYQGGGPVIAAAYDALDENDADHPLLGTTVIQ